MFLLRRLENFGDKKTLNKFTFQYVSIKTNRERVFIIGHLRFTFQYVSIKTPLADVKPVKQAYIYIPICFY